MYKVLSIKYLIKTFSLSILATLYLLLNTASADAQTMSNQDYIIKMQDFDTASGVTAGDDYELRSTVGGLSPVDSGGVNFKVKTGFENLASAAPFSIHLSSGIIDFGTISATNPVVRTVDLKVNSEAAYGYSVIVFENESPAIISEIGKTFIPDTTCDNGQCDTQESSEWINALTYGFGYRCDNMTGANCDSSFAKSNFYRHFPNITSNDDPVSIMAGIGANNKEARISYKVNVSGNQAQGAYRNTITYIAIPNF